MTENLAQSSKRELTNIYAVGLALFIGFFGTITMVGLLVVNMK